MLDVIVSISRDRALTIEPVIEKLTAHGLIVRRISRLTGLVTGNAESHRLAALRDIDGVDAVLTRA